MEIIDETDEQHCISCGVKQIDDRKNSLGVLCTACEEDFRSNWIEENIE